MKSLSLFGVLLLARILILVGRDLPLSFWSPLAYLWQDLLVVLVFAGLERITPRRPWISWIVYGMSALYVAINVPLFRLMFLFRLRKWNRPFRSRKKGRDSTGISLPVSADTGLHRPFGDFIQLSKNTGYIITWVTFVIRGYIGLLL